MKTSEMVIYSNYEVAVKRIGVRIVKLYISREKKKNEPEIANGEPFRGRVKRDQRDIRRAISLMILAAVMLETPVGS